MLANVIPAAIQYLVAQGGLQNTFLKFCEAFKRAGEDCIFRGAYNSAGTLPRSHLRAAGQE